ncbi:unnamed protein product [Prunus armeniaca]|uniref:Uncharacterized protein n=1 Tax=Prunus armeniaca TaxID=36596 RepID=A0A6J5WX36_PRUAR|nr:unnamed protein product [Prunus armeniaca]
MMDRGIENGPSSRLEAEAPRSRDYVKEWGRQTHTINMFKRHKDVEKKDPSICRHGKRLGAKEKALGKKHTEQVYESYKGT